MPYFSSNNCIIQVIHSIKEINVNLLMKYTPVRYCTRQLSKLININIKVSLYHDN